MRKRVAKGTYSDVTYRERSIGTGLPLMAMNMASMSEYSSPDSNITLCANPFPEPPGMAATGVFCSASSASGRDAKPCKRKLGQCSLQSSPTISQVVTYIDNLIHQAVASDHHDAAIVLQAHVLDKLRRVTRVIRCCTNKRSVTSQLDVPHIGRCTRSRDTH